MTVQIKFTDWQDARNQARKYSAAHPGYYITFYNTFGLFLQMSKKLHVFAPSDAPRELKFYYLNGKEKPFSKAQQIQDQNRTPTMA